MIEYTLYEKSLSSNIIHEEKKREVYYDINKVEIILSKNYIPLGFRLNYEEKRYIYHLPDKLTNGIEYCIVDEISCGVLDNNGDFVDGNIVDTLLKEIGYTNIENSETEED